jgi:Fe-S-cluster-containing dehydrogenase component
MVMDITRCNGCYNCFLACRDEFSGNDFPPYSMSQPNTGHFWMRVVEKERGQYPKVKVAYTAIPCMHCEEPLCAAAARDGAVYRREDGIVIIDPAKAAEQRQIVDGCPHRVIFWNEEKRVAQKCTFCAHLLDAGWKEPRCVEACPTDALVFGDLDDPDSGISKLIASGRTEELHPEYGLGPAVRYVGLPKRFVAGAVVFGDTDRCGEGAEVTLEGEAGGTTGSSTDGATGGSTGDPLFKRTAFADNYGDFEFEGLAADKVYRVTVSATGYETRELTARTNVDLYLGEIVLQPAVGLAGASPSAGAASGPPPAPRAAGEGGR